MTTEKKKILIVEDDFNFGILKIIKVGKVGEKFELERIKIENPKILQFWV